MGCLHLLLKKKNSQSCCACVRVLGFSRGKGQQRCLGQITKTPGEGRVSPFVSLLPGGDKSRREGKNSVSSHQGRPVSIRTKSLPFPVIRKHRCLCSQVHRDTFRPLQNERLCFPCHWGPAGRSTRCDAVSGSKACHIFHTCDSQRPFGAWRQRSGAIPLWPVELKLQMCVGLLVGKRLTLGVRGWVPLPTCAKPH